MARRIAFRYDAATGRVVTRELEPYSTMTQRITRETNREEAVNVHLAEALKSLGIAARAERRSRQGIPDVRVDLVGGYEIILECKYEGATSLFESQLATRMASFPDAVGLMGDGLSELDAVKRGTFLMLYSLQRISSGGCTAHEV